MSSSIEWALSLRLVGRHYELALLKPPISLPLGVVSPQDWNLETEQIFAPAKIDMRASNVTTLPNFSYGGNQAVGHLSRRKPIVT